MRVNIAQSSPPTATPSHTLSPHSSQTTLQSSLRIQRSSSATLSLTKSTVHNPLRRSCSASFDDHDYLPIHKSKIPTSKTIISTSFLRHGDSHVDVLEPSLLGIRPDPPEWPARDAVIRECIARRANSIDIPLSLRMIKMKQKFDIDVDIDLANVVHNNDPMSNLCCSSLYIIREVQSYALKSRGMMLDEELDDGIVSKVQREMTSSFLWLFKEVFAKTPDLMVQVMMLTSNFATHSLESFKDEGRERSVNSEVLGVREFEIGNSRVPVREILEESEVGLWNSVVDEADQIRGVKSINQGLEFVVDRDLNNDHVNEIVAQGGMIEQHKKFEFVSPVKVEIERDDYEEYHKTDLLYQIGLLQDPNNTLLLSNYAQFLCLVSRDYDRAEECLKRAIQLDRNDAEIISLYANFLWVIRKDLWGAEERFQQAVSAEPDNSYHASKYASFLWSTGGDETCYPIDPPLGKSESR